MSNNLTDLNLLKLFPENFRDNVDIKCYASAFNKIYPKFIEKIVRIRLFSRIESLNSDECDFMAHELNVDFYEQSWDITQKRNALYKAFYFKVYKGTAKVISDYIANVYNSAQIQEWFEYNGLQYHFKIVIKNINVAIDDILIDSFERIIQKLKPLSRKCDSVEIINELLTESHCISYYKKHKLTQLHLAEVI